MKVKITMEFDSEAEAAAFLGGKSAPLKEPVEIPQYVGVDAPVAMTPAQKAAATRAKKAAAEAAVMPSSPSSVPTGAFPSAPAQPLNPIQMPAVPHGMPMPAGMPGPAPVNYGAPMQQAPQVAQPQYVAPAPAAVAQPAQQWDRVAVISNIQTAANNLGQTREAIQSLFGQIFNENGIAPAPVGQLTDQDLYKFQLSFYAKTQNPQHLV